LQEITLNGRTITRADGALRLADGTLAGADLDMIDAVNYVIDVIGVEEDEAFRMASLYAAQALGIDSEQGHLAPRAAGNFVHLNNERSVQSTWISGSCVYAA
jgi:N-acetylglucosamine-6-phosphate deacetylase